MYPRRVILIMHLTLQNQPITVGIWTSDRSVNHGRIGVILRQAPKAVVVARGLIHMDSEDVAPERVDP